MDYEMPVMNGPTATKALREAGCDVLIIGVTGNLLPEDVRYFRRHGADAVLGKPLDIQAFEQLLLQGRPRPVGEAVLVRSNMAAGKSKDGMTAFDGGPAELEMV
jgi:CheY-like chemotaxis protein